MLIGSTIFFWNRWVSLLISEKHHFKHLFVASKATKKNPFYGPDWPRVSILVDLFLLCFVCLFVCLLVCLFFVVVLFCFFAKIMHHVKLAFFWPKPKKTWLKNFDNNWEYFKICLQKKSDWSALFVFLRGAIFATRKKQNKKMFWPTDPIWKVCPPVKTGVFFRGLTYINLILLSLCNDTLKLNAIQQTLSYVHVSNLS